MKALTAVLPDITRLVPRGHGWFTLWVAAVLIGLELFGRVAAVADYVDVLAVLVLGSVLTLAVVRHRKDPHPWFAWLGGLAETSARRVVRLRHEIGIDFRGEPPLTRRLPRMVPATFAGLAVLATLFACGWLVRPAGWRELVAFVSYDVYLLLIAAVWTGLVGVAVAGVLLPIRVFEGLLERLAPGSRPAVAAVYLLAVLFVSFSFPPAIPLVFAGLILVACALAYVRQGAPAPGVVWKGSESKVVSVVPAHRIFALGIGLGTTAAAVLIVAACGGTLLTRPDGSGTMPLTTMIGAWAAWFLPGVAGVLLAMVWGMIRNDPARRTPPTLHVADRVSQTDLAKVRAVAAAWGWRFTSAPLTPSPDAVPIRLVPQDLSEAREFEPTWPLKVSVDDLSNDLVKDRLVRRDEIQLRRSGFRGLKKLFKKAGLQKGNGGAGVLFAPHWWFIDGLDREDELEEAADEDFDFGKLRRVGPTYDRVLKPRVRQHWHAVLRATQVDLMFLEDGVSPKQFEKVLRQILDIYDRHAGTRKAEDHLFRGIPKVKVMIHEYAPGQAFDPGNDYPEPKFLELSRARVLHVFKDRGDAEELEDVPFDMSWEPEPVGVYS